MSKTPFCPLIRKDCKEHQCAWYLNIQGENPQTGEVVNNWQCAINAIPLLQIETSRTVRQNHSATVGVREEINKATKATVMAALGQIQPVQVAIEESK
jgi:hypothetical protein